MPMSGRLRRLLLAGTCLCVCGTPVHLPNSPPATDGSVATSRSIPHADVESPSAGRVTGPVLGVSAVGGAGPRGRPKGTDPVTQTGSGDGLGGGSGPGEAGGDAQSHSSRAKTSASLSEMGHAQGQTGPVPSVDPDGRREDAGVFNQPVSGPAGGRRLLDTASSLEPPQLSSTAGEAGDQREADRAKRDPEASPPSTSESPNPGASSQRDASVSCIPPSVSPRTSTHLSIWGRDETMSSLPDPIREDGPGSLWTEASRPGGGDTAAPPSQDEATEGTMSSEALPLIFEPFEDVTTEAVAPAPGSARPPAGVAAATGPSDAPSLLMPDWTSPWQTSGGELLEPQPHAGAEDPSERGAAGTPDPEERLPATGPSLSSFRRAMTTVTMATRRPAHKSRSGLEEMESEEEPDEDEDDENSEDSVEDDSEEDLTETPKTPSTRPPYSLIPPPPVWFQRNQGLMRSWVELIREKAGYVSGMLVPVGIGITGALLIVGALYSIRVIHRKRRNSFKHQRRKVRQHEFAVPLQQPLEPGTDPQDQTMLLADSSEDEF
ncbi:uncharacterized protein armh4 isoform X3 [Gasterosteus aculeatus]